MAVNVGSLLVSLGLDSAEFKTGLSNAEKEFRKSTKRIEAIGNSMGSIGKKLSLAVSLPLAALGVSSVKAAVESNKAIKSVEATLASMGSRAGYTAKQLESLASGIMRKSLYDDDEVLQKVTNTLLTFGNISGAAFERAQQAAVDLSAKFGTDLQSSALMVGKALQDPVKGLTALNRAGISFSPAQVAVIKSLVATGQSAKAVNVILQSLEKQVRGSAQAMRDADPVAGLRLSFGEFQEQIGQKLLPLLPALTDAITKVLDAFGQLSPGMQEALIIGAGLATAFGPLLTVIGSVASALAPFVAGIRLAAATAAAAGVEVTGFSLAMASLRAALVTALAAVAPYAAVLGGLALIYYAVKSRAFEAGKASETYANIQKKAAAASDQAAQFALKLAGATGKVRAETIAAAKASREKAKQNLAEARTALLLAEANISLLRAYKQRESAGASLGAADPRFGFARSQPGAGVDKAIADEQANAGAAYKALAQQRQSISQLTGLINSTSPGSVAAVDAPSSGSGRAGRGGGGPSAADIEQRFQDERANIAQQYNSAKASAAKSADEQAEYERRNVELARIRTIAGIKNDADYSEVQKQRLIAATEDVAEIERQAVEHDRQVRIEQEANDLAQAAFEQQRDVLSLSADMADTQADRKRIALEILDLEQRERRTALERVASSQLVDDAQRKRAQQILAGLGDVETAERASAGRRNETEVESYLRNLRQTPEQINEAIDGIRIDGLERLNDGIVQAITGVKSLGAVFKDIASQIISDLLRIAIRKAIIEPLAGALFGGSSGGALSKAIGTAGTGALKGARASGGPVLGGMPYLVGERGPEIMVPGHNGTVISNRNLRGMGGGLQVEVVANNNGFGAIVRNHAGQVVAEAAPSLMQGGAKVAQSQIAYRNTRRVA